MNIVVTGSAGMLGSAVTTRLEEDHRVMGIDLPDADLTDRQAVDDLMDERRPDWVIHCAAWTDVDGAESHRDRSEAVNATATGYLAQACRRVRSGITYLSTDYVFDGTGTGYRESDRRQPINHYGRTKCRGEETVEILDTPWQIVRTSWLFGDGPRNFIKTIRRLLAERETLKVVDDQRGCPTYTEDLADVLAFLVNNGHGGIFHGTNTGSCTWFELAQETARLSGHDPGRIEPCPGSAYPTAAVRPACSVLLSERLDAAGCPPRPAWQDAVARYVAILESGARVIRKSERKR